MPRTIDDSDWEPDYDNDNDGERTGARDCRDPPPDVEPRNPLENRMIPLDPSWRQLATTPIPGAAPLGSDPADDPAFEAVENQIELLNTAPAEVNWDQVIQGTVAVLSNRGKDWRMACRLTAGLWQVHGLAGLPIGLGILADLIVEPLWGQCFPPLRRLRLRGNYLLWLSERLGAALDKAEEEPDAELAEGLSDAVASLNIIDDRLSEALGDFAPILHQLRGSLERLQSIAVAKAEARAAAEAARAAAAQAEAQAESGAETPAEDADTPPTQAAAPAPAQAPPAPAASPPPAAAPATPMPSLSAAPSADMTRAMREIKSALVALAANLRDQRLADPRPYLLLRMALWLDVERPPPNRDGVTDLPEPSLERRRLFADLTAQSDWPRLIAEVEKTLGAGSVYWLDGHRLVANALEAMGSGYQEARAGVVAMLGLLLRRLPGLERLKFMQGSGFADDLTQTWIAGEVLGAPAGGEGGGGGGGEPAPWLEALHEAAGLAVKGKAAEGLGLFRAGLLGAGNERERFQWQLAQARACIDAGLHTAALAQVGHLEQLVARYQLEQWEPALALEVAHLYAAAHGKAGDEAAPDAARADMHQRLLARLYCYDVAAAVSLGAS